MVDNGQTKTSTSLFETSLIYELCPVVLEQVKALRLRPLVSHYAAGLPQPHVTALFMGFLGQSLLEAVKPEIAVPPYQFIDAELQGWGYFIRNDETFNVHIRVKPEPNLIAVHQWALRVCHRFCCTPPADISGDNYVPHITIADGVIDPDLVLGALKNVTIPAHVVLSRMQIRAHPWPR